MTVESVAADEDLRERKALRRKRRSMSEGLHPVLQVAIALVALAILVWPADMADSGGEDFDGGRRRDL